jgi:hypothetical protein
MATAPQTTAKDPFFDEWLPTDLVRVVVSQKHDQWYVVAQDFNIAGIGETKAEAERDLLRLVSTYLRSCYAANQSYEQARRPIPRRARFRNWLVATLRGVLKGAIPTPLPRTGRLKLRDLANPT